jgi:hypothetical protein
MTLVLFITGVVHSGEQLITGVVDTGDKHKVANISVTLCLNLKWSQCDTKELKGNDSQRKIAAENLVSDFK